MRVAPSSLIASVQCPSGQFDVDLLSPVSYPLAGMGTSCNVAAQIRSS